MNDKDSKKKQLRQELVQFYESFRVSGKEQDAGNYEYLRKSVAFRAGNRTYETTESYNTDHVMEEEESNQAVDYVEGLLISAGYYEEIKLLTHELYSSRTESGESVNTKDPVFSLRELSLRQGNFEGQVINSVDDEVLSILNQKIESTKNAIEDLISHIVEYSHNDEERNREDKKKSNVRYPEENTDQVANGIKYSFVVLLFVVGILFAVLSGVAIILWQ